MRTHKPCAMSILSEIGPISSFLRLEFKMNKIDVTREKIEKLKSL